MPETLSPFGSFAFSLYRPRAAYEGRKEGREGADLKEKGTTGFRDGAEQIFILMILYIYNFSYALFAISLLPFLLFPELAV